MPPCADPSPPLPLLGSAQPTREFAERLLRLHAVTQDRLGMPWGNCLEAAVATILGVGLDEVPDPRDDCSEDACATKALPKRNDALTDWLAEEHGLVLIGGRGKSPPGGRVQRDGVPLFWIASGPSRRGFQHAVVYSNDRLVWDPHPDRTGLVRVERWSVLVPLGPLRDRILPGYVVPTSTVGRRVRLRRGQ